MSRMSHMKLCRVFNLLEYDNFLKSLKSLPRATPSTHSPPDVKKQDSRPIQAFLSQRRNGFTLLPQNFGGWFYVDTAFTVKSKGLKHRRLR